MIQNQITYYLNAHGLSVSELARLTGLPRHSITNVISGRSRKTETLQTIATALGVEVEKLTAIVPLDALSQANQEIDPELFVLAAEVVNTSIRAKCLIITKGHLDLLINILYAFIEKSGTKHKESLALYIEGALDLGINAGVINANYKTEKQHDPK
jgi:transcriptional regulator with XRE-family HTH domain